MASLADRIRAFLNPPTDNPTTQQKPAMRGFPALSDLASWNSAWSQFFAVDQPRITRYTDYDRMDNGPLGDLLDIVCDACFIADDGKLYGPKIAATNPKYQQVADQVLYDTGLKRRAWEYLHDTLKYGDTWVGLLVDDFGNIVALENPDPKTMVVKVDVHNRLRTGRDREADAWLPYWQIERPDQQSIRLDKPVASWQHFEMRHLKFMPSQRSPYSLTSLFEMHRADWHKLNLVEQFMVVTRLNRTSPRQVHYIDITGKDSALAEQEIKNYINRFRQSMTPRDADGSRRSEELVHGPQEDFFMPTGSLQVGDQVVENRSRLELQDPNVNALAHLPDVEHLLSKMFARTPGELVGFLRDRNDINQQDIAFARFLQYCQHIIEDQLIRPVLTLALLYKFGGVAQDLNQTIQVVWPNVIVKSSWRLADAKFRTAMAYGNAINDQWRSREETAKMEDGLTDEEWEERAAIIKKERDEFPPIDQGAKVAQVRQGNNSETLESIMRDLQKYSTNGNGNHADS